MASESQERQDRARPAGQETTLTSARQASATQAPDSRLRVSLALLDRDGVIVSVNQAWQDFAGENGGDPARSGVGQSYLAVCDAATDPEAAEVATAVRQALRGELPAPITVPIPCHTSERERWYDQLISSRFTDDGCCIGATVTLSARERRLGDLDRGDARTRAQAISDERTRSEILDQAVSRLLDAQSLLDTLGQRLETPRDRLAVTATFENLDAVIRDLRPRRQWRAH